MASKRVLYAALTGNLLVAVTKAVAAVTTGSSAMVSEAVHSFVDTGDQLLLLFGPGLGPVGSAGLQLPAVQLRQCVQLPLQVTQVSMVMFVLLEMIPFGRST